MPPPALVAGPRGELNVWWWDARNGACDVFAAGSADGGASWGEPVRPNDDAPGNGRHRDFPGLAAHDRSHAVPLT